MKAFGPLPAARLTNSASLKGLTFLVALLSIERTDRQIELTVRAGDHSGYKKEYHRTRLKGR